MYSSYEASLKESILSLSTEEQDALIKLLEKKNGLSFGDDKLIAILKHLYLLDLNEANNIIQKYISPKPKNKKFKLKFIKRSGVVMKKLKDFFNSELCAVILVITMCILIIFFGFQNL